MISDSYGNSPEIPTEIPNASDQIHRLYRMPRQTIPLNPNAHYNGCPTQDFAVCREDSNGRGIAKLRWGLVPSWAKSARIGARLINARAETVHEKPAFRAAFRRRRCLVPAAGWLEWRQEGSTKQPWFITRADREPISFAGLWERWANDSESMESFTVITTVASPALADIHHLQPSVIEPEDFDEWLSPDTSTARLLTLARDAAQVPFDRWPVSRRVNNARNNTPDLLLPLNEQVAKGRKRRRPQRPPGQNLS